DAYPTLTRLFADGGYAGQKLEAAVAHIDRLTIEIIRRSDITGFVILPRRWVVERTLAWLNRCRRLAKDWEASIASSEAWMV
ncbi:transposase, partial [Sphingomonas sp. GC_Shp_2]